MRQLGGVAGSHSEESVGELVAYPSPGVQREAKKPPINFMMLVLAFRMVMRVLGLSKHGNLTNDMGRILGYDKMTNKLLKGMAAGGLAAALIGSQAKGATMFTGVPSNNGSAYSLNVSFLNNDNGVAYNSAITNAVATVAQDIFDLGNHSYASLTDMMNSTDFSTTIRRSPAGEVNFGWSAIANSLGVINLTNNGFVPGGTYDIWQNTLSNSTQDTMALRFGISNSILEKNGIAGYQWDGDVNNPLNDYGIGINPVVQNDMFVGTDQGGFNNFSASGNSYQLIGATIPEPSTTALLGLGALGALGYRKRKE
jgi:hypothetical protein